jgi:hypothetical protein
MVTSVRVARDARIEAAEAARWYEEQQERTPLRDFARLGVRALAMRGRVFFIDRGERVVIAFAHDRRGPGYWLSRLSDDETG